MIITQLPAAQRSERETVEPARYHASAGLAVRCSQCRSRPAICYWKAGKPYCQACKDADPVQWIAPAPLSPERPRPPVSVAEWLARFRTYGYGLRENVAGNLVLTVPESMSDEEYTSLARYVSDHDQELSALLNQGKPALTYTRPRDTRYAVLYRDESPALAWIDHNDFHVEHIDRPRSLAHLADLAYPRYIARLWVAPGFPAFSEQADTDLWRFSPYYERSKQHMMGVNIRKRGHKDIDVHVVFPEHSSWYSNGNGWVSDASPFDTLVVLRYLKQALGIEITGSPGSTGWAYLKTLHPEWIDTIETDVFDLRGNHFTGSAAPDIIWQDEDIATRLAGARYIHKFDQGASYPYAGTQTDIGVGIPEHLESEQAARAALHEKRHPQEVGVWLCRVTLTSPLDPHMPPLLYEQARSYDRDVWLAGPVIRLLRSQGHRVDIQEGYIFPERRDLLVQWGNALWKHRQKFRTPGAYRNERASTLAARATKQVMNDTIGITAFRGFDDDEEMKRPDIRMQVIARHRELIWHNVNKIKSLYNVTPVIVYMDALYYLSNIPDGRAAFPELVKREGQLGGYKYEGCIKITPDLVALGNERLAAWERLERLNREGWVTEWH